MKKIRKTLRLNRELIRNIGIDAMGIAVGGAAATDGATNCVSEHTSCPQVTCTCPWTGGGSGNSVCDCPVP